MNTANLTPEQFEDEALKLPLQIRAKLAERLLASLDEEDGGDQDEIKVEQAWAEEIQRRDREITAGTVQGEPADRVFARIRAQLRSRPG